MTPSFGAPEISFPSFGVFKIKKQDRGRSKLTADMQDITCEELFVEALYTVT